MASPYRGGPPPRDDEPAPDFRDDSPSPKESMLALGMAALGASGLGFAAFGSVVAAAAAALVYTAPAAAVTFLSPPMKRALDRHRARSIARGVARLEALVSSSEARLEVTRTPKRSDENEQ
jgi:hypothetical protein